MSELRTLTLDTSKLVRVDNSGYGLYTSPELQHAFGEDSSSLHHAVLTKNHLKQLSKYYNIPQTLVQIDEKHNLNTFGVVLNSLTPEVSIITDGISLHTLDPRSTFTPDSEFESLLEAIPSDTKFSEQSDAFQRKVIINFQESSFY